MFCFYSQNTVMICLLSFFILLCVVSTKEHTEPGKPEISSNKSESVKHIVETETQPNDINKRKSNNIILKKDGTVTEENTSSSSNTSIMDTKYGTVNQTASHAEVSSVDDSTNVSVDIPAWMANIKSGALERTGFVALGIMSVLLFFFVVRAVRIRQKKSKSRKYGIITSNASDMEMEPLDRGDDDEEDTTLFDAHHKYRMK